MATVLSPKKVTEPWKIKAVLCFYGLSARRKGILPGVSLDPAEVNKVKPHEEVELGSIHLSDSKDNGSTISLSEAESLFPP